MSLLEAQHIVKPGSMYGLGSWNYIKRGQMTCQVCCSQRQEKTNFHRSQENQTHSKTHPSLDKIFSQIFHLAEFDLGSHKWINYLRCRDVFKSVSSFPSGLDPHNQVNGLQRVRPCILLTKLCLKFEVRSLASINTLLHIGQSSTHTLLRQ